MPLSDNNIIGIRSCIIGEIEFNLLNCLLEDWLILLKIINIGIIIEQYIR